MDVLKLNASDTNSVDDVRSLIYPHITSSCVSKYKIVWLEEADYLSPNAQGILRDYMETYEQQARFILTCNNLNRIIPAIRSRTQCFKFTSMDLDDVKILSVEILKKEKIKCNLPTIEKHVSLHYPDIRAIINSLEQYSTTGTLLSPSSQDNNSEIYVNLLSLIQNDQWDEIRTQVYSSLQEEELEEFYEYLYNTIHSSKKFGKVS